MQIIIRSKQMDVSPRMRSQIERKLQRLARLVGDEALMDVTVVDEKTRSLKDRYTVHLELTNVRHMNSMRATVSDINVKTALDLVLDKITTQLGRQRDRHVTAHRLPVSAVQVLALSRSGHVSGPEEALSAAFDLGVEQNEEVWTGIKEIRRIETLPMKDYEVISQMEREGLSFYPFINSETSSVNVMYRLPNSDGYGLLVPDTERAASSHR